MMVINTRKGLESDMREIRGLLLRLGKLAGEALAQAVRSLETLDMGLAEAVIAGDDVLDDLAERIEETCMNFGARYQPLGKDLRAVISTMHMAIDLERIGDYGVNIARAVLGLGQAKLIKPLIDIPRMLEVLLEMLDKVLVAYDVEDPDRAEQVFRMDEQVDALEKQVMRELFTMVMERPERFEQAFLLIGVGRTLERAGDHLTNIAERVVYICSGRMTKASRYKSPRESDA